MSTTIDVLGKIMGSTGRVKLMRLFLFHPDHGFTRDELVKKTKITSALVRTEIALLEKAGFINKKEMTRIVFGGSKKRPTTKKKRVTVFILDKEFPLLEPIQALLLESELIALPELPGRLKSVGKIKLLVATGIFMNDVHRSIDLLVVGDKLDRGTLQKNIAILESEIGKELRYATFDTEEFMYRIKMYDKLIRDIFDFPHQKLIHQIKSGF